MTYAPTEAEISSGMRRLEARATGASGLLWYGDDAAIVGYAARVALAAQRIRDWQHGEECPAWGNVECVSDQWRLSAPPASWLRPLGPDQPMIRDTPFEPDEIWECECDIGDLLATITGDERYRYANREDFDKVDFLKADGTAMSLAEYRAAKGIVFTQTHLGVER